MARPKKPLPPGWKGTAHLPATKTQIKCIHTLANKLRMEADAYHYLLARHAEGVMHSNDLNRKQASAVITELAAKVNGTPAKAPAPVKSKARARTQGKSKDAPITSRDNIVALATPPQRALIGHLIEEVVWHAHGGSYEAWLLKNQKLEKVATKEEARRVIEGLKGLKAHGHARSPHT